MTTNAAIASAALPNNSAVDKPLSSSRALARSRATARYAVACAGLVVMCIVPVSTVLSLRHTGRPVASVAATLQPDGLASVSTPSTDDRSGAFTLEGRLARTLQIEPVLPAAVAVWLVGVLLLSARLVAGYVGIERLKRQATRQIDPRLSDRVLALSGRLGLGRPVRVLESAAVQIPTVVGWLRPVILLPAAVISGLPVTHLDAVVAHELAHIRRHDYLVNAAQAVIETLLFYHPAVWWCSQQIRIEREHCCDDVVVQMCGDRLAYATALTSLEEQRSVLLALSVSASGGRLIDRVRRVLSPPPFTAHHSPAWMVATVLALVLVGAASAPALWGAQALEASAQPPAPSSPSAPRAPRVPRAPGPAGETDALMPPTPPIAPRRPVDQEPPMPPVPAAPASTVLQEPAAPPPPAPAPPAVPAPPGPPPPPAPPVPPAPPGGGDPRNPDATWRRAFTAMVAQLEQVARAEQELARQVTQLSRVAEQIERQRLQVQHAEAQLALAQAQLQRGGPETEPALAETAKALEDLRIRMDDLRASQPDLAKIREQLESLRKQFEAMRAR